MQTKIIQWLERDSDPKTREELQHLVENSSESELKDRFGSRLAFGTAGLRGKVGAGPNRMNCLVIQETATGLGRYLIEQVKDASSRGIVIGYDGRTDSKKFAHDTASVLTALGIKVYLTYKVAATPIVAFGVCKLNAAGAVVVTASHNPPEYNGFKVYWENGAQIIPPHDFGIAAKIEEATTKPIPFMSLENAKQQGLLVWLEDEYYQTYRKTMNQNVLLIPDDNINISIAYTAMHGVGADMAETLLADAGFKRVVSVPEQREPDGTFPTVNFPNPEEAGAMDMVMALGKTVNADIVCANDPDADRLAVAVKLADGEYQMLTGDQVGSLFGDYLLEKQPNSLVGNSIVSSRLLKSIAKMYGADYYQTLTGFKWLTNVAIDLETKQHPFLFAYEEALGYTVGNKVWDKDGMSALVAFCQLTGKLKAQGKTLWNKLEELYRKHGFYFNSQRSMALDPNSAPIGDKLRANPPKAIAGKRVSVIEDLKTSLRFLADGSTETINLPASDVLVYYLEDQSRVILRPSGTEPKLKCYYEVVTEFPENMKYAQIQQTSEIKINNLIEAHQNSLLSL